MTTLQHQLQRTLLGVHPEAVQIVQVGERDFDIRFFEHGATNYLYVRVRLDDNEGLAEWAQSEPFVGTTLDDDGAVHHDSVAEWIESFDEWTANTGPMFTRRRCADVLEAAAFILRSCPS